jgi:hypothetical protein
MCENVLHVHTVVDKLDKGNDTHVVTSNIDDPPFVLVPEIIQRRKHTPHLVRRVEFAFSKNPVQVFQSLSVIGMRPGCIVEWALRNNMHATLLLTFWQL